MQRSKQYENQQSTILGCSCTLQRWIPYMFNNALHDRFIFALRSLYSMGSKTGLARNNIRRFFSD